MENPNKGLLFLSFIRLHKPVEGSSISRWIKKVLKKASNNTRIFKTHSTRSASTSKASSLSEKEILEKRNLVRKDFVAKALSKRNQF